MNLSRKAIWVYVKAAAANIMDEMEALGPVRLTLRCKGHKRKSLTWRVASQMKALSFLLVAVAMTSYDAEPSLGLTAWLILQKNMMKTAVRN